LHENGHLQNAWNKYGEDNFVFVVMQEIERNELLGSEQWYLDTYNPDYNIATQARASFLHRHHTEETKALFREQRLGVSLSDEHKRKIGMGGLGKSRSGEYVGVSFRKHADRWMARINVKKKEVFLGYYDTEELAAMAYDRAALYYFPDDVLVLNFPDEIHEHDLSRPYEKSFTPIKKTNTSGFRGVTKVKRKNGIKYTSSIGVGSREDCVKVHFGTFDDPKDAACVYDLAQLVLHRVIGKEVPREYLNYPDGTDGFSDEQIEDMIDFLIEKGVAL